jgi:hypothetical protein
VVDAGSGTHGLGKLLEVHGISEATAALRSRNAFRLGCLPVGGALLLGVGLFSMLTEKDDPADHAVRAQALMLMAGLLALCAVLFGLVVYLYVKAKKAAEVSNISVYEDGIVVTRARRWGRPIIDVCPWTEIADLKQRSMGPALLGLTLTRSDGSTLFLAKSFDNILKIEEHFQARRRAG